MSTGGVVAGLVLAAAAVGAYMLLSAPPPPNAGYVHKPRGGGWYVLLYNYPRGNRDRRLKSFDGPFSSKVEAKKKADSEKDTWYPQLRLLQADPQTLGL